MSQGFKKWLKFALRWGIAIAGIWWVFSQMSLRDHVLILNQDNIPVQATLAGKALEGSANFEIYDPWTHRRRVVSRSEVVNAPESSNQHLTWRTPEGTRRGLLLALDLGSNLKPTRFLLKDPETHKGVWVSPADIEEDYVVSVPHPKLEVGINSLVALADPVLLTFAVLIMVLNYIITSFRWHELLKALEIHLGAWRVFVLNMVGAFYNTFIPGTTGGDLLKAYYAAQHTQHRTHAVMSVVVDRVIGLFALIVLGGVMAGWQYFHTDAADAAVKLACGRVALGSIVLVLGALAGLELLSQPRLRRITGIGFLLEKLPLQRHVQTAIQVIHSYRRRARLVFAMILVTLPVHITTCISAMLAGMAFGLPLPAMYYFVCVPVIVLAGAIPISPQGAGVMEFFAIALTQQHGVTVSQAFALTMSIRMVSIIWNLTGGVFVFRGGYHAPTAAEQAELETGEPEEPDETRAPETVIHPVPTPPGR